MLMIGDQNARKVLTTHYKQPFSYLRVSIHPHDSQPPATQHTENVYLHFQKFILRVVVPNKVLFLPQVIRVNRITNFWDYTEATRCA